tara:strand:+ start:3913 stop:4572 length:660 start_codon:yes stop_codon:yes gene_type:complete
MDYLTIVKKTWLKCGLTGAGPASVTSQVSMPGRIIGFVDDAYAFIQGQHTNWKFLWKKKTGSALTIGDSYYIPGDLDVADLAVLSKLLIQVSGEWAHVEVVKDEARASEFDNVPTDNARPTKLFILPNGAWQFNVPPDLAYPLVIEYYRVADTLTVNASVPSFPADYHRAIIARAVIAYAQYDEDQTLERAATNDFSQMLYRLECNQLPLMTFATSEFA